MAPKKAIARDKFVAQIVADPANPPQCLLFKGFVGTAGLSGYIRLYSDAELADYVDIPKDSIVYSQPISSLESPLGGSRIWIRQDAQLKHSPLEGGVISPFLDGPIYQDYLKQSESLKHSQNPDQFVPSTGITRFGCPGRFTKYKPTEGSGDVSPGPGPTAICARPIPSPKRKRK